MRETMRAARLLAPERMAIESVTRPQPGPDDVLVRVERCGICGTDLHIYHGAYSADRLPLTPGHEIVGIVEAAGERVRDPAPGTRVVVDNAVGCGCCFHCRRNEPLACRGIVQLGIHVDGGFAESVVVPARLAIPVPDGMPVGVAALVEPLACVVRAQRKITVSLAESVLVLGCGPIGNFHVQLARLRGAAPILAFDRDPRRTSLARDHGADVALSDPDALAEAVRAATDGRGVDVVIESVGAIPLYEAALELVRPGGRVAAFGLTGPDARLSLSPLGMILGETSLVGSVAGTGEDMRQALALLAHGRIETGPFTRAVLPLQALPDALAGRVVDADALKIQIEVAA